MARPVPVQDKQISWYENHPIMTVDHSGPARARAHGPHEPLARAGVSAARALGEFIRTHRERLTPAEAGLPPGPRRRTPGLRREEVAQLCGVSPTWYTWIEQGRPVSASADALARIAVALRLSRAERAYLFELAAQRDPAESDPAAADAPAALIASVGLIATPAYVLDRQWNALAWNAAAADLFVGWLERGVAGAAPGVLVPQAHDAAGKNLLRYAFTAAAARMLIVDWETRARRLAAEFRADSIRHLNDAPTRALLDALIAECDAFARFWASQEVFEREGGRREFDHPARGRIAFDQITFKPAQREDLKLVLLIAQDSGAGADADVPDIRGGTA
jgi:transcriptional regulator with XRE-family HTH domain